MFVHVPKNLPDTGTYPLVLALHGCSQNARRLARQTGWNKLAEKHHFIMVYPQQRRFNNPSKCFNWFRLKDNDSISGEAASINSMANYSLKHFPVDSTKVFTYGLSAGAAMSVSVMANFPETFNAGAVFAGAPYGMASNIWKASGVMFRPTVREAEAWGTLITSKHDESTEYPRLIVVHGLRDKIVNIQSSRELVKQWSFLHKTDEYPFKTLYAFENNPLVYKLFYYNAEGQNPIIFYMILKTGHEITVNPGKGDKKGGRRGFFSSDKDFFSTYYIAKDFGIIP
ncbi:MAG: PHB depolymerase family esterase [Bacteroidales bacterium]|nr:PHB depolymerase family esterase [Bacteroidales bacterium]